MDVVVITSRRMPTAMDDNLLTNRSKLLKLAENIKTRKKPGHKKSLSLKEDPSYTNIEHLVFGTFKPRPSPSEADTNPKPPQRYLTDLSEISRKHESKKLSPNLHENTVWYHSLDRSRLIAGNVSTSVMDSPSGNSPNGIVEFSNGHVIDTDQAALFHANESDVGNSKHKSVISRSRQKPPVHLNSSRSPPTRLAVTLSNPVTNVSVNEEHSSNKIVVKVKHLTESSCNSNNDNITSVPVPSDTSSSSLSNSNLMSEISDTSSESIPKHHFPPVSSKPVLKKVERKQEVGKFQPKPPPVVATNRSAMLRQSRASCSLTKSNVQQQQTLSKNGSSLKSSSCRGSSLSGSRGGSLSGSRNSLSSSRGSLVNASTSKVPSKLHQSKSVNQRTSSKPVDVKSDKGPPIGQKPLQKVSCGKNIKPTPTTSAPALPAKTRPNANRRPSVSRVQISGKKTEENVPIEANNSEKPMIAGLTLAVVGKDMGKTARGSDISPPTNTSTPLPLVPPTKDIDDEVRYIKSLPSPVKSPSGSGSPERNFNLEKPNKPLYTWYDTRKRGSYISSQTSPPVCTMKEISQQETSPFKMNRLTTSLPKSFVSPKFSLARRMSETVDKEEIVVNNRRDSDPDNYERLSNRTSINSISETVDHPTDHPNGVTTNQTETLPQTLSPPSSPSGPNTSSPCGRPHGNDGCLRCSTGGQKLAMELRLLHRDHSMPKCVRRIKASSSPPAFIMSSTDLSASDSDLRRPWSQVYSEAEAQRVLEAKSRVLESITLPNSATSSCADLSLGVDPLSPSSPPSTTTCKMLLPQMSMPSMFTARCSSLRAPGVRASGTTMENVLQKFRKSFSLRFQRQRRPASPLSSAHSTSSTTLPDGNTSSQSSVNNQSDTAPPDDCEENTLFRFGPLVWRSSKERKVKSKKTSGKCSSPDSGIHVEMLADKVNGNVATCSPGTPKRGKSSSLRLECQKRSLSAALSSSASLEDATARRSQSDLGSTELIKNVVEDYGSVSPAVQRKSGNKSYEQRNKLRRSVSQPMEIDKMASALSLAHYQGGHSDREDSSGLCAYSDDEPLTDEDNTYRKKKHKHHHVRLAWSEYIMYAEALWDHVTMDPDELPFKAGDLVAVVNCSDRNWWWGALDDRMGWFPADFVRARVNQTGEPETTDQIKDSSLIKNVNINQSINNNQIRTNVIKEIISTERDFVQHLKDVIEGYLKQVRKRPDMFPEERINTIFGNMEQIHTFQSGFLRKLEECIDWELPHQSCVGACFVNHRDGFQVYSEYCNNHPQALSELQQLFAIPKYSHFFEACRLLQEMIDISLDGFLLTPVQKICKYPLQLAELLKFTPDDHPDQLHVAEALHTMRQVAQYINERKRRMECLEKIATWQLSVEDWEGSDILDISSELIHSGDVTKVTSSWSRDLTLFLFDHQLIICKRDLLKRNTFCYKGRICTDQSEVIDLPDGRDTQSGLIIRHAWRMYCGEKGKWVTFCSKTCDEKNRWMKAFKDERNRVEDDEKQGFVLSDRAKITAMSVARNKLKRSKSKSGKEFLTGRRTPRVNALINQGNPCALKGKTGSLPHGLVLSSAKKKNASGWFAFGSSNKKQKR